MLICPDTYTTMRSHAQGHLLNVGWPSASFPPVPSGDLCKPPKPGWRRSAQAMVLSETAPHCSKESQEWAACNTVFVRRVPLIWGLFGGTPCLILRHGTERHQQPSPGGQWPSEWDTPACTAPAMGTHSEEGLSWPCPLHRPHPCHGPVWRPGVSTSCNYVPRGRDCQKTPSQCDETKPALRACIQLLYGRNCGFSEPKICVNHKL